MTVKQSLAYEELKKLVANSSPNFKDKVIKAADMLISATKAPISAGLFGNLYFIHSINRHIAVDLLDNPEMYDMFQRTMEVN